MNNFVHLLQSWQPFYTTIASVSATLTGLMFVSLSLNRQRLDEHGRMAARHTFARLIDLLALALIFLIPHEQPGSLGIALISFGFARIIFTVADGIRSFRTASLTTRMGTLARQLGLQFMFSLGIVILGFGIYKRNESAMFWPVGIVVALLGSASGSAWELLFKE